MADETVKVRVEGENKAGPALTQAQNQLSGLAGAISVLNRQAGAAIDSGERIATAFAGLSATVAIVAALSAAVAGVALAAGHAAIKLADSNEQLERMAAKTGVAVPLFQAMSGIIEDGGGQASGLSQALSFLNRAIATGDPLLGKLGITTKDTGTAFLQLASMLARSGDTAKSTEIAMRLLGRGGAELIPHMGELADKSSAMAQKMLQTGEALDNKMRPAVTGLDNELDEFKHNWTGLMNSLGAGAAGPMATVIKAFNDMAKAAREAKEARDELNKDKDLVHPSEGPVVPISDATRAMMRRVVRTKTVPTPLPDVKDPPEKSEREKRLESIAATLGVSRERAEALLQVLERIERTKAAEDLKKQAGILPSAGAKFPSRNDGSRVPNLDPNAVPEDRLAEETVKRVVNSMFTLKSALEQLNVAKAAAQAIFSSIDTSMQNVFRAMLSTGQTLKKALDTVWDGIKQGAFDVFAQIAAMMIKMGILKLLDFIVPGLGTTLAPFAGVGKGGSNNLTTDLPSSAMVVNNINALDVRSIYDSMTAPGGPFRAASMRQFELSAAGA